LATPGQRLLARIVDGLVIIGVGFCALQLAPQDSVIDRFLWVIGSAAAVLMCQAVLLSTCGQHIGKVLLGLRIVREDGTPARFVHAFLMRDGLMFVIGLIPGIGGLIRLTDNLCIFTDDHRCLHDRIAGTRVVQEP